jgi:ABC-type multidrug transport system ATPase subunit
MTAILAERLTRRFGDFTAVRDVNLRVEEGEIFGFLGPNGSGKTTIIKMLTGLLKPTDGSAWVSGTNVTADAERVRQQIGYMSQTFSLYHDLTVRENLHFYSKIYGLSTARRRERLDYIITMNALQPYVDRKVAVLSGGWKQRLALGCAMIHEPKIMFLDEPTAGIDPVARRRLWDLIFELSGQGMTFFVTTHYMDEAERCSHVAYLYYGQLIADGTPESLSNLPQVNVKGTRRIAITAPNVTQALGSVRRLSGVYSATIFGRSIHAVVDERMAEQVLRRALTGLDIEVSEVRELRPSLEDVFVDLTCQHEAVEEGSRA